MSLVLLGPDGVIIRTVEPSGNLARFSCETVRTGNFDGIPVTNTFYGAVQDLPAMTEGTIYVVSSLVAQRVPYRPDVFIPNESVMDDKGRIIGCRSLAHV